MQYEFLAAWTRENGKQNLIFQKIERFEDQYLISFKKQKLNLQVCLSANCFCFFTKQRVLPWERKKELSLFNQHLTNARLSEIIIAEEDRIITLRFSVIDIYNQKSDLDLILELIPRYQNIILLKNEIIVDCLRKVSFAENRHRQILPGLAYDAPDSNYEIRKMKVKYPMVISNLKLHSTSEKDGFREMNSAFESLYYNAIFTERNDRLRQQNISAINKNSFSCFVFILPEVCTYYIYFNNS